MGDSVHVVVDDASRRSGELKAALGGAASRLRRDRAHRALDRGPVRLAPDRRGTKRDERAPAGEIRIVADRLTKRFGDFVAVNAVSFEARRGEIIGFLGPNGAGKSTTIRILCGLLRPSGGRAEVAGFDVARFPEASAREHRLHVAEVLALRRSFGDGESALLRRRLWGQGRAPRGAAEVRHRHGGAQGRDGRARRRPFRRLEAAARAWLRGAARAGDPVPRRADLGRRSRLAPPLLGPHLFARRGVASASLITTHYMDEAEYCNRIALINARQARRARQPERAQAQRHPWRNPARRRRRSWRDARSARRRAGGARRRAVRLSLHIVVDDAAHDRPAIESVARGSTSSRWSRIETIKPTLEDVFVRLVGGDAAPQGGP